MVIFMFYRDFCFAFSFSFSLSLPSHSLTVSYQLPFVFVLHFLSCPFSGPKFLQTALKIIMFLQPENVHQWQYMSRHTHTHTHIYLYIVCRYSIAILCIQLCVSEMTTQSQVVEIFTTFLSATETKTYEKCYENFQSVLGQMPAFKSASPSLPLPTTLAELLPQTSRKLPLSPKLTPCISAIIVPPSVCLAPF